MAVPSVAAYRWMHPAASAGRTGRRPHHDVRNVALAHREAIVLLKKTQALIKNLNEQSRRDHSLYVCMDLYDDMFEELGAIINTLGETE
jgi:hypothetical protein